MRQSGSVDQAYIARTETRARRKVVALLILLSGVTYLDRVCISVAGPRMQEDLLIDPVGWGWVTGVFTLSYCLFEVPTGSMGDRIGPRRVLTRIVLWWSAFTALTGAVRSYAGAPQLKILLVTRFLFGAGEAGAYPNACVVTARWFPPTQRTTISGVILMASQLGGALAPLLVVPIQARWGWRAPFFLFGALGVLWAAIWHAWFRDSPAEKTGGTTAIKTVAASPASHAFPWRAAFRSQTLSAILAVAFCYVYVYNFFQTWFHTFLVKGRGFSEEGLLLSSLPYAVAVFSNLVGGATSDALTRQLGRTKGRRLVASLRWLPQVPLRSRLWRSTDKY